MLGSFAIEGKTFEPWCVEPGEPTVIPLFDYGESMTKVASSLDHVPHLQQYINAAQPEEGWYQLLIHAAGADEVWGGNKKGDAFPEKWLNPMNKRAAYGYKTFTKTAQGYVHHRNKPEHWTGSVLAAGYSAPMARAELIVKFNIQRLIDEGAPYFVSALDSGQLPAVSMGCRVPFDICSICGNKAPTVALYCDHLKYQRMSILPDGRRVRMFNPKPIFHDISLVSSPADRAARVLLKIAEMTEMAGKMGEIDKKMPAQTVGSLKVLRSGAFQAALRTSLDPDLTLAKLIKAAAMPKYTMYSTLTGMGILLRPHEFAAISLAKEGNFAGAESCYLSRTQYPIYEAPNSMDWPWIPSSNGEIEQFVGDVKSRSIFLPAITARNESGYMRKQAHETLDGSVPEAIQYGYAAYRKTAEKHLLDGTATNWAHSHLQVLTAVLGRDIPISMKFASLDHPREVFTALVQGGSLPTSTLVGG